jgi:preprotein translocase subunit SecD
MLHFPRWQIIAIVVVCLVGLVATLPNFFEEDDVAAWPDWLPHRQLVLGLDLQGGSHLLLEVHAETIRRDRLETLRDDVRQTLRQARIGYTGLTGEGRTVEVHVRESGQIDEAARRLNTLATQVGSLITGTATEDVLVRNVGGGVFQLELTQAGLDERVRAAVDQSIEIVRRRVDELGTTEPNIQRQGADRIVVQVPGLDDPERLKALIGQTAQLTFRFVDMSMPAQQALDTRPPPDSEILYSSDEVRQPYLIERRVIVSGEDLVDAQPAFDQRTNEPIVTFRFDSSGAQRFARATQQNVGRPFAIILDNEVISAPVIREPILGGSGQISGGFTVQEANDLAILLRAGALPAPLTVLEERTVGPGLGADSIEAGRIAALVAGALVITFMIAVYGLFGIFANIALLVNMTLLFGVLSALGATLTLPGIAGIVLTIGMAVDANVLIYERIREEQRAGRTAISSIDAGYSRALSTIMDANITTLIAAVILFYLGSGPIRGFAITLAIGIVTTLFTAYMFNRLVVSQWIRARRPSAVPI